MLNFYLYTIYHLYTKASSAWFFCGNVRNIGTVQVNYPKQILYNYYYHHTLNDVCVSLLILYEY